MKLIYVIFAFLVGTLIPVQGGINSQLGRFLNHPIQASFISFTVGTTALLLILIILNPAIPQGQTFKEIPWYLFLGGLCGAVLVTTILVLFPKIGATKVLAAIIVGELVMSLILDHFGWFNTPVSPINWSRAFEVGLLFLGYYFIGK